ncbi:replication factor C subunit 3 [Sitophilus oryzae]|uniref:Replication factor C subunit 3 n=1 Tax=Sitophilus oryzae TaxID=7048 RepID=A0A6J2X4N5_SITOR|nr:replication factor C subunit 3 [Sitophilus oryzae]
MSLLWVDKYRPKDFASLDYHIQQAQELKNLVERSDFPHMLIYGPSGAGKKTRIMCILKELFGPGVERLKMENVTVTTPSNKKVEIMTVNSNYHIEINPSDVGIYDRVIVMDLIKNIAQGQHITTTNNPRDFKVVVLTEADNLTNDAQHALRRTMEKYSSNCRLILCATSLSPVIPAIQSRCLLVRVPAPCIKEIVNVLQNTCKKEDVNLPLPFAESVAKACNGNLRRAILMCEACKVENNTFQDVSNIPHPDWEIFIRKVAKSIMDQHSISNIMKIRNQLYELLTNGIPAEIIFRNIVEGLVIRCDPEVVPYLVREAAIYEHRMTQGNKHIIHLEAFAIKAMCLFQKASIERHIH